MSYLPRCLHKLFFAFFPPLLVPAWCVALELDLADDQLVTQRPNILLIVAEDMSPRLGSFGDNLAKTPAIDALAREGIRFDHAYTVSGVCAPSRSSLITGVYATSMGTHQMRTSQGVVGSDIESYEAVPPPSVKAFPELLRASGYSTANFAKKDYQFGDPFTIWDLHAGGFFGPIDTALWRKLPDGKPWFVMMNLMSTHESRLVDPQAEYPEQWSGFVRAVAKERAATVAPVTAPEAIRVPAYFPDTKKVRASIAQHYDNIHFMDSQVAAILSALEEDGLADDTIVIWTTDHGDAFPRAKRAVYESGVHVPLVLRYPDGAGAGSVESRLVSFVDIAPSILSMAGVSVPTFIQGRDMFAGEPRDYVFSARDRMDATFDRVRAVRDERYRLVENFAPELAYFRPLVFRDMFPIMQELWRTREAGLLNTAQQYWFSEPRPRYELYDVLSDPDEVVNLAGRAELAEVQSRLIAALNKWRDRVGDLGEMSELDMVKSMWGGDEQPVTATPRVITQPQDSGNIEVVLEGITPGSSLGYRLDEGPWKLYTKPFVVSGDRAVEAKAIRYGYSESPSVTVNL